MEHRQFINGTNPIFQIYIQSNPMITYLNYVNMETLHNITISYLMYSLKADDDGFLNKNSHTHDVYNVSRAWMQTVMERSRLCE